jgi:uncharacterized protein (TIGR00255 family)
MITSMTGFGRSELIKKGIKVIAEIRSVNSRYLEITTKLPKNQSHRENDLKEIINKSLSRGKINVSISVDNAKLERTPLIVNKQAARDYYKLLNELRKSLNIKSEITLDHLLKFSELLEVDDLPSDGAFEWSLIEKALDDAIKNLSSMRQQEGRELKKDLTMRINLIESKVKEIEKLSIKRMPLERERLRERVNKLLEKPNQVDDRRIDQEIIFLSEKLDITEECTRIKSHNKFFIEAMAEKEPSGRKLNFLIQELNREANTIASKANDATISHIAIGIKEELEKIREQIQNIE